MTLEEVEIDVIEFVSKRGYAVTGHNIIRNLNHENEEIKTALQRLVDEGELAITLDWKYRIREDDEPNFKL